VAGQRHLLILDNLESITGSQLAIRHTLTAAQQREIKELLQALAGGKTTVLLGSRSREDWLAEGTFGEQVYELPGLDPEAASELTHAILERQNVMQYQKDLALQELLKLLDGYPLPLEVVLANLTRQPPATVLAALKAGDVALDSRNSQDKTRSILRCIEYSHSNLSADAQGLLNCLAPFTGVVNTQVLPDYTEQLKQQPTLAGLPFEHWQEVLQEAVNWGLLNPHPKMPVVLQLQPVLPFFLRSHWQGQADRRGAVETAFRQLYDQVGREISQLLDAKEAEQKQAGQVRAQLEYENLTTALDLALAAQMSMLNPYVALSGYLDSRHDEARGLALGKRVLERLEDYSPEQLAGPLGAGRVRVIDDIAKRQLLLKHYEAAEASYQKALSLLLDNKSIDADTIRKVSAGIYHQLGAVAQEQRRWAQAEDYYQKALAIKIEFNDRYGQAGIYHQWGYVAQEQRHWEQAEDYYQKALAIKIELNDRYGQAGIYHNWGYVAQEQRHWEQAEDYYQKALAIFIEFNDRYGQAGTYHHLGYVAQEQRRWGQAEDYYQKALALEIEFNDRYRQAGTYHHLGMVAEKQRRWGQAEDYYQKALALEIEFNNRYWQAGTYHQLGMVAKKQRRWAQALDYYLKALSACIEFNDEFHLDMVLRNLARLWQAGQDPKLPTAVGAVLKLPVEQVEEMLNKLNQG